MSILIRNYTTQKSLLSQYHNCMKSLGACYQMVHKTNHSLIGSVYLYQACIHTKYILLYFIGSLLHVYIANFIQNPFSVYYVDFLNSSLTQTILSIYTPRIFRPIIPLWACSVPVYNHWTMTHDTWSHDHSLYVWVFISCFCSMHA